MSEFSKKYRPRKIDDIVGQQSAVASMRRLMERNEVPKAILLTGPSGVGKTTMARVLKRNLECGDQDYQEMNSASVRGIETIRGIERAARMAPISGDCRMWVIDEAHQLTKEAQEAILKLLEDGPKHSYFILATTTPAKLIKAIHTRCTEVKFSAISDLALGELLAKVKEKEQLNVSPAILKEIIEASEGSARKALVILQQVAYVEGEEAQSKALKVSTVNKDSGIMLARALMAPKPSWPAIQDILREMDDDPEGIRRLILAYAGSCLLSKSSGIWNSAFKVVDIFSRPFYDSNKPGLIAACYEASR